jgi:hypothetical protein
VGGESAGARFDAEREFRVREPLSRHVVSFTEFSM